MVVVDLRDAVLVLVLVLASRLEPPLDERLDREPLEGFVPLGHLTSPLRGFPHLFVGRLVQIPQRVERIQLQGREVVEGFLLRNSW